MSKKNKKKVVYYDDNSTIADMSAVSGKKGKSNHGSKMPSTFKDKWNTYWNAARSMVFPMLLALFVLAVIYVFLLLISR